MLRHGILEPLVLRKLSQLTVVIVTSSLAARRFKENGGGRYTDQCIGSHEKGEAGIQISVLVHMKGRQVYRSVYWFT